MEAEFLEGKRALGEALDSGAPLQVIFATQQVLQDKKNERLFERARRRGVQIKQASKKDLDARSSHGAHQGIVAQMRPYQYASLRQLIAAAHGQENALIIAADHITDAGNFGAIARSAEIVGATGLLIPNKRSAQVNVAAYKTSAGAVMHLPIAREANLVRSLEALKQEGFWVVGASEKAPQDLWHTEMSGRIVLVMGSEGEGLSQLTLKTCDLLVKLPQHGHVASLNVAQATTALAYEWLRQCQPR